MSSVVIWGFKYYQPLQGFLTFLNVLTNLS
jgi:hypothetical protein